MSPRVAGEEENALTLAAVPFGAGGVHAGAAARLRPRAPWARSGRVAVVWVAPEDEQVLAVEAVGTVSRRAAHRGAEASRCRPAVALRDAFGERVCVFVGGDRRRRYRSCLTRGALRRRRAPARRFAPPRSVGLLYVPESHPPTTGPRPYHHVRDVALQRGRLQGGAVVLVMSCLSSRPRARAAIVAPS
jgi:hypothetical protein